MITLRGKQKQIWDLKAHIFCARLASAIQKGEDCEE